MQWGNKHLQAEEGGPLRLVEPGTGERAMIGPRTEPGKNLDLDDLAIVANGNLADPQNS